MVVFLLPLRFRSHVFRVVELGCRCGQRRGRKQQRAAPADNPLADDSVHKCLLISSNSSLARCTHTKRLAHKSASDMVRHHVFGAICPGSLGASRRSRPGIAVQTQPLSFYYWSETPALGGTACQPMGSVRLSRLTGHDSRVTTLNMSLLQRLFPLP